MGPRGNARYFCFFFFFKSLYTQAPYRPYRKSAVAFNIIFYYLVFTQQPDRHGQIFSVYRTIWLRQACQTFSGLCGQKRDASLNTLPTHSSYTLHTWFKMEDADIIEFVRARLALFNEKDKNYTNRDLVIPKLPGLYKLGESKAPFGC